MFTHSAVHEQTETRVQVDCFGENGNFTVAGIKTVSNISVTNKSIRDIKCRYVDGRIASLQLR